MFNGQLSYLPLEKLDILFDWTWNGANTEDLRQILEDEFDLAPREAAKQAKFMRRQLKFC